MIPPFDIRGYLLLTACPNLISPLAGYGPCSTLDCPLPSGPTLTEFVFHCSGDPALGENMFTTVGEKTFCHFLTNQSVESPSPALCRRSRAQLPAQTAPSAKLRVPAPRCPSSQPAQPFVSSSGRSQSY